MKIKILKYSYLKNKVRTSELMEVITNENNFDPVAQEEDEQYSYCSANRQ